MMKRSVVILVLVLSAAILLPNSCRRKEVVIDTVEKGEFLDRGQMGYYVDGATKFTYRDSVHQKAVNARRRLYRYQTNEQDTCLNVVLGALPKSVGVHIMLTIDYFDPETRLSNTVQMECSKVIGGKMWFWDPLAKVGVIIGN